MKRKKDLNPFSENLIIERLKFENPWWIHGSIDPDINSFKRRLYYDLFLPLVLETDIKRAVILMGPRRVGKTVIMYHTIQHLLEHKINKLKIAFINIENPIYTNMGLEQLFSMARKATGNTEAKDWFVFFDEIQYLKDWEVHLKVLVDSYPQSKFVVSGSAAAALKMKSNESGAGRFTEFMLPPLTFSEYIHLKDLNGLIIPSNEENIIGAKLYKTINIRELNKHFIDYINYGGYPEVIFSEKIQSNVGRYIRSDIVDKVLLRDLPSLYGIQDVQELNSLFSTLAYHSGNEISLESLSKASQVEKYLLKKYLEYLEAAFLIKVIHRIDDSAKKFMRANFYKVYLTNSSLRSALFAPLQTTDEHIGNMVETAIYSQWLHRDWMTLYYARWQNGEVDMVYLDEKKLKPIWTVEIKWSNLFFDNPNDLKSLISFCKNNNITNTLCTTIDKEGYKDFSGIKIQFIPASLYAYIVGNNTLEKKKKR